MNECCICYKEIDTVDNCPIKLPCKHKVCTCCLATMHYTKGHHNTNRYSSRFLVVAKPLCPMCRGELHWPADKEILSPIGKVIKPHDFRYYYIMEAIDWIKWNKSGNDQFIIPITYNVTGEIVTVTVYSITLNCMMTCSITKGELDTKEHEGICQMDGYIIETFSGCKKTDDDDDDIDIDKISDYTTACSRDDWFKQLHKLPTEVALTVISCMSTVI